MVPKRYISFLVLLVAVIPSFFLPRIKNQIFNLETSFPSSAIQSDNLQMSVPMDNAVQRTEANTAPTSTQNWTINVSDVRTIKVSNVSQATSEKDIKEFLSFSGEIHFVELQRETETTQVAYVTFKDSQGADTAMLLTGANISGNSVFIYPVENYQLPPHAPSLSLETKPTTAGEVVKKAEDVVSTMLAKGFVLGKDAVNKAKSFDERHHLTSNATATVASIERKIGLIEKLTTGTAMVNGKVREMDERFQVSEITKYAYAAAEEKASNAGYAIMSNPLVSTGASWVSGAFNAFAKAAGDVSTMTREKVEKAEEVKKGNPYEERAATVNDLAHMPLDKSSVGEVPVAADDGRV